MGVKPLTSTNITNPLIGKHFGESNAKSSFWHLSRKKCGRKKEREESRGRGSCIPLWPVARKNGETSRSLTRLGLRLDEKSTSEGRKSPLLVLVPVQFSQFRQHIFLWREETFQPIRSFLVRRRKKGGWTRTLSTLQLVLELIGFDWRGGVFWRNGSRTENETRHRERISSLSFCNCINPGTFSSKRFDGFRSILIW